MSDKYPVNLEIWFIEMGNRCLIVDDTRQYGICFRPAKHLPFRYKDDIPMCEQHMNEWGKGMFAVRLDNGAYQLSWQPMCGPEQP